MAELKIGIGQAAERAKDIIENTVDSMTRHIMDEVLLEQSATIIRQAASEAAIREELDRLEKQIIIVATRETEKAGSVFIEVVKEAAIEAVKEIVKEIRQDT